MRDLGGLKCLYAHAYYTEEEFWTVYNRDTYDALRRKYGAEYLPNVFEKVRVDVDKEEEALKRWTGWLLAMFWSIWPFAGVYGALHALLLRDYLISRKPRWISALLDSDYKSAESRKRR